MKCQYRTTLKSLFSRGLQIRNDLKDIHTKSKRIVKHECDFYKKYLDYMINYVYERRRAFDEEHLKFVRSCMNSAKIRNNKTRHPITGYKEDSHDTDLMSLVSYIRKDIAQLEEVVDQLQNKKSSCPPSHSSEHDHVDVIKNVDEKVLNFSGYVIDDYTIYERSAKN